ncbi:Uncharacterized protein DBV15_11815 [Temnothorax longispinosus]|uniref:Uncharacterized protein n=1 Tax=Temnothorax longispinosus TaxID=300112 RepID=A0A4S2KA69_9HYME|nr:Uncharacterized protein DBV15_11815 [Temnothorax longispinosus]
MFFRYTRMDVPTFYELLQLVGPFLQKGSIRAPICPEQRLAITLRYLATGDQMLSVALAYRVHRSYNCQGNMLYYSKCSDANLYETSTEEEWTKISSNFVRIMEFAKLCWSNRWQAHNYPGTSELWLNVL